MHKNWREYDPKTNTSTNWETKTKLEQTNEKKSNPNSTKEKEKENRQHHYHSLSTQHTTFPLIAPICCTSQQCRSNLLPLVNLTDSAP